MGEFVVNSEREAKLRFHSRRYQRQGSLVSYDLTLEGHRFSATARVGNSELGTSPVVLFDEMATELAGWKGEKSWAALDGEMSMVATTDSLGTSILKSVWPRETDLPSGTFGLRWSLKWEPWSNSPWRQELSSADEKSGHRAAPTEHRTSRTIGYLVAIARRAKLASRDG